MKLREPWKPMQDTRGGTLTQETIGESIGVTQDTRELITSGNIGNELGPNLEWKGRHKKSGRMHAHIVIYAEGLHFTMYTCIHVVLFHLHVHCRDISRSLDCT